MAARRSRVHLVLNALLRLMAWSFNLRPALRRSLHGVDGPLAYTVAFRTESGTVEGGLSVRDGKVRALSRAPQDADVVLVFRDDAVVLELLRITPNEVMNLLLKNQLRTEGNLTYLNLFNFHLSLLLGERHRRMAEAKRPKGTAAAASAPIRGPRPRLRGEAVDPGVKVLDDPYLSQLSLHDFPRLARFLEVHLTARPSLCAERPKLLTDWFRANGFEEDRSGRTWSPVLRQGLAMKHLLEHRAPRIREGDLIAGTTTTQEIGVVLYPDAHGTLIWGELGSLPYRELNPYDVSPETAEVLHREVFPFWARRNFREHVRARHGAPLCQVLDERFAVYFLWKTAALSHTIPDFPTLLRRGTLALIEEARAGARSTDDAEKRDTLEAMALSLEGLNAYALHLSEQARREAARTPSPVRREELERLASACAWVPMRPARDLDEAVNAIWITWVGLHMESTNAGLSLGRLDQWLQPYFEADAAKLTSATARAEYVKHAVELIGCFYLRCTDHLPLIPDVGNYLFGGSSSDQAITLGGVTPAGEDAVCDLTYVFLKVTELLGIRDPNVNARYHPEKNSETYLRRLCEVNLITTATPSLHNDLAVMASLEEFHYPPEHLRDWAATGCVEPTLCGKHLGHTNSMMMNLVAALELALNDGYHPLMRMDVGPRTGRIEAGAFPSFEAFFEAFSQQLGFLIDQAVAYNNLLGEAHAELRPTPLLSSLIEGCASSGRDATRGGALHNSSGAACIGLADVTDSLMVIKHLVFDTRQVSFEKLKQSVDADFRDDPALHAKIRRKVPLFGSGSQDAVAMAQRVAKLVHDRYGAHRNFRGGPYTAGFWSMSNHVAFGTLTGALPSGRLAGKPFTPGLTPQAFASRDLLDNLRDVASLDPRTMNNNVAFNVKVVPSPSEPHATTVDHMKAYVGTYFALGGMQLQLNVMSSKTLRDAMVNPDNYRNLLVRISGYNAYFTTLNRDLQLELIERAEYGIA